MYLVTGGAGFIGSNIVAALAEAGEQVVVCDWLDAGDKWRNIAKHEIWEIVFPEDLAGWLTAHGGNLAAVVHMGAISTTTETDGDLIVRTNLHLSQMVWDACTAHQVALIYASSAATYGDGSQGFADRVDRAYMASLRPLTPYAWSKHAFDRKVVRMVAGGAAAPPKWSGLKFFNVYGPNEYHKGAMRSVIAAYHPRLVAGEPLRLFRSDRPDYTDGGQLRDFVYVMDCVDVVLWMLRHDFPPGIYNVGTGQARTWLDLGRALFAAIGRPERIAFIDIPDTLRGRYQYVTQAEISKLAAAGYTRAFTSMEDGIADYVQSYLSTDDPYR